ncbi:MAG: hypothetical protein WBV82_16010, partial [Myxococcaceae bacterium]
ERERAELGQTTGAELQGLRQRVDGSARERAELIERATRAEAELTQARARVPRVDGELAALRASEQELRAQVSRYVAELERERMEGTTAEVGWEQAQLRIQELERELAERTTTVRDLAIQNEQLKGRIHDAEGLRSDYVRMRTTATEAEFLKGEVARLEEELRTLRLDALGAQRQRPARSTSKPVGSSDSIGESLESIIERFSDSGTRSIAVADPQGFPLASRGDDALSLAAFAALLLEAANRARQFLPFAVPSSLELVDDRGARVTVWPFQVDDEPLLLTSLAVTPVESGRAEATLVDLAAVLRPLTAAAGS